MADFIGIDAGSSFLKAAVLDLDSFELRRVERVPFPEFLPGLPAGHREVAPAAILKAVEDLLCRLECPHPGGVVLCSQMHGFLLIDSRGEPVSNYVSWLDQRVTAEEFEHIETQITAAGRAELGNEVRASIALSGLYWLKQHGALPPLPATPVSIGDFIVSRLSRSYPAMEPTHAAAFGALRLATMHWHDSVIGKLGLDCLRWPQVVPTGTRLGRWNAAPCYAAVGDQQCALAGALLRERELSVNIGTGSQIALLEDVVTAGMHQTRPYFDGRFLRTITHIPGGRALSALIGLLTEFGSVSEEDAWKRIEAALASTRATDLRASIAFYPGPCGYGGFLENLHEGNLTAGHVFRAVFESMAGNYAACALRLDPGSSARRIVFSGGVARRLPLLRDLTAAALGLPQRLSPHPEDTLLGLMVLARAFRDGRSVQSVTGDATGASENP